MHGSQVVFSVGRGLYSFDSMKVASVESGNDIRILPGAPECISGLADLRGELVPVCDLNKKFRTGAVTASGCDLIFVTKKDGLIACTVDKVIEIGAVTEDLEIELPYLIRNESTEYIDEIVRRKDDLVTVINADKLLSAEENEVLDKAMNKVRKKAEADAKKAAEKAAKEAAEKEAAEAEGGKE